jgi:hypothetical protein
VNTREGGVGWGGERGGGGGEGARKIEQSVNGHGGKWFFVTS